MDGLLIVAAIEEDETAVDAEVLHATRPVEVLHPETGNVQIGQDLAGQTGVLEESLVSLRDPVVALSTGTTIREVSHSEIGDKCVNESHQGKTTYSSIETTCRGAFWLFASCSNISKTEGGWVLIVKTGVEGLMMPAFCRAISSIVLPSTAW